MLERLGVNTRNINLNTNTVAAVMVTANLPPFSTQGTRIDVNVSALGDADSLQGGTLLVTPLVGALMARFTRSRRGRWRSAAFQSQADAASVVRGVPTAGQDRQRRSCRAGTGVQAGLTHDHCVSHCATLI